MKKLALLLILSAMLVSASAFAEEPAAAESTETPVTETVLPAAQVKTLTLTLPQAIELALTDNSQLNAMDIGLESSKTALKAAKETRAIYKSKNSNSVSQYYVQADYAVKQCEEALKLAPIKIEKEKNNISYKLTSQYFNCKLAQRLLEIAENSLALAQENKNAVQEQLALGMVSQLEADNADVTVQTCQLNVETCKNNLENAYSNLKIILNIDYDCNFVLTDEIGYTEFSADYKADSEKFIETNYSMLALKSALYLAQCSFDNAKGKGKYTSDYQSAYSSLITAQHNYDTAIKNLKLAAKIDSDAFISANGQVDMAIKTFDIEKRNYEASKIKYDMGMISNLEFTKKINELAQSENNLESLKLSYRLAVEKYSYTIGVGID